jgi:autotransporter-associated beta strand protein
MHKTDFVKKIWLNILLYIMAGAVLFQANGFKLAAATFVKADNTTALNLPASWTNNAVPGNLDTAVFDGTFSAIDNNANLGASMGWLGIMVSNNLNSAFTINASGASVLSLNGGGISMTNANQDLTINVPFLVASNQFWDMNAGRTLTFNGLVYTTNSVAPGNGSSTRGIGGVNGTGVATVNFRNNVNFTNTTEVGPWQNFNYLINIDPAANGGTSFIDKGKATLGKYNNDTVTMNILSGNNFFQPANYFILGDGSTNVPAGIGVGPGNATVNILGGVTMISNSVNAIVLGGTGTGIINVNNASLIMASSGQTMRFGGNNTANQPTIAPMGVLNITNNATVTFDANTVNSVDLGYAPTGTGIINLYANCMLITQRQMYGGAGLSYFNFYGGTVQVQPSPNFSGNILFQNNLTRVMVGAAGGTIDDGGTNVFINAPLQHDSSVATDGGLIKMGSGRLMFNFDPTSYTIYNGNTIVNNGTLQIPALGLSWGAFFVNSGATLTVRPLSTTGNLAELASLNLSNGSSITIDEGLTNAAPLTSAPLLYTQAALTTAGTVTINITNATFSAVGQYALINYGYFGGSLAGAGFGAFKLGSAPYTAGYSLTLSNNTSAGTIDLVVGQVASLTWDGTVNNIWDINSTPNWKIGQKYADGILAVFDDTLTGVQNTNILLNGNVSPAGVLFNNNAFAYAISGAGGISGTNTIAIEGGGMVTLANTNQVSGATYILSGTLQLGDRVSKNGSVGGTINNSGTLIVANSANQTLANQITGAGNLILNSTNVLVLAGSNNLSQASITVNGGTLSNSIPGALTVASVNLAGTLGSCDSLTFSELSSNALTVVSNSVISAPQILFPVGQPANTFLLLGSNTLSFSGQYLALDPSTATIEWWQGNNPAIPATVNTYGSMSDSNWITLNGVTWNANLGTNMATISKLVVCKDGYPAVVNLNSGTLNAGGQTYLGIADTSASVPNSSTSVGALNINGGVANIGATGRYLIGNGGTAVLNVYAGQLNFLGNGSSISLGGDSAYAHNGASGTLNIFGGNVTISNGSGGLRIAATAGGASGITGTLNLYGGTLTTWPAIVYAGTNTANSAGFVEFNGGTLKAGTNQTSFLQGLTQVSISTNGAIIDDSGYSITIGQSLVTDSTLTRNDGGLIKLGAGMLSLTNLSTYTGNTVVSNGNLQVIGGLSVSPVRVVNGASLSGVGTLGAAVAIDSGGWLVPGTNSPGILTMNGNLTLNGSMIIAVNKSQALSNSLVVVSGNLASSGAGTIIITNLGPDLAVGDTLQLFNKPVVNGNTLSIVSTNGGTWTNNLALNGTIQLTGIMPPINPLPGVIQVSLSGSALALSWPTNAGWLLQAQTDTLPMGLSTNWVAVPGSEGFTNLIININSATGAAFYRLVHP